MRKQRRNKRWSWLAGLLIVAMLLTGCTEALTMSESDSDGSGETQMISGGSGMDVALPEDVPDYAGSPYAVIHGNEPYFTEEELNGAGISYEQYSELDSLGRCGACTASVGQDLMPTEKRGDISSVHPSGWHSGTDPAQWNRGHLIGYQLSGENDNERNLITMTRAANEEMIPYENMIADYVKEPGNHVLYRVTPVFDGDDLIAAGVRMEAESVEDQGEGILFHIFCYNVQPGVEIDYATGDSWEDGQADAGTDEADAADSDDGTDAGSADTGSTDADGIYVVNARNGKIHIFGKCSATDPDSDGYMEESVRFSSYEEAERYSRQTAPEQTRRKCGNCW